jgi:hypothetical protein
MLTKRTGEAYPQLLAGNNGMATAMANAADVVAAKVAKATAEGNGYNEVKDVVEWLFSYCLVR